MSIIFDAVLGKLRKADAGGSSGLTDAPSDGKYYVRKDGAWEDITGILSLAPSYTNPGGMGNRQSIIIATTNIIAYGGSDPLDINRLIDGAAGIPEVAWEGSPTAGSYLRFQFESAKIITEMKFYTSGAENHGTWKVQGSNDGTTWTDIGSTFAFNATPLTINLSSNTERYLYYQLLGVSGTLGTVYYEQEIEFKISR